MTAFYAPPHRFSESLNVVQYQAVTHPGGPLLVSAGPGTGKTRVLTYRVAWLLDQGVSSSAILMLTFSYSAAQEMLSRAAALAGRTKTKLRAAPSTALPAAARLAHRHKPQFHHPRPRRLGKHCRPAPRSARPGQGSARQS